TRVSKVYYVLGEVNAPGSFTLSGRETVLDGILAAGGLNERASRRNIILSRPTHPDSCRVVLPICYYEIVQLGDTSTNYQLAPGGGRRAGAAARPDDHGERADAVRPCRECSGAVCLLVGLGPGDKAVYTLTPGPAAVVLPPIVSRSLADRGRETMSRATPPI